MTDRDLEQAVFAVFAEALGGERARVLMETGDPEGEANGSEARRAGQSSGVTDQLRGLNDVSRVLTDARSPASQPRERSAGETGRSVVATVLKTALGTVPLAHLVAGLFGGGSGPKAPPPLTKYTLPAPIRLEKANRSPVDGRLSFADVDYGQNGAQRIAAPNYSDGPELLRREPVREYGERSATAGASAPQITVNVQAMDSRSFLDHSDEIARAVRHAMLNMHALNDVVSEL